MRPAQRWPLHPAPKDGEALSSWLNRVAGCYQMDMCDLLEHDLGHRQVDDMDAAPPLSLLDSLDDRVPSALETYVFQLSVLLPKQRRKVRSITHWRAWIPIRPLLRACPLCLQDATDHPLLLMWQLPLLLSCPLHGCWLEPYLGVAWQVFWLGERSMYATRGQ